MKIIISSKFKAKSVLFLSLTLIFSVLISCYSIVRKSALDASAQAKEIPTIIIDAGHGGIDGGTHSYDGTLEKDINLSIALMLRDILINLGYPDIVMTRELDVIRNGGKKSSPENIRTTTNACIATNNRIYTTAN